MSSRSRSSSRARPSSGNASKSNGRVPLPRNGLPQNEAKKRVGNYVIGNTVGEGTFGKVKCAIHIPTGEKVAVKILEKKRIQEQADVKRVNREIKILKKARHSNIIQLFEVLDTPNSIYLIMENADGGEMFDYIVKHRHVHEKQACKFFHQILNGVEELHKNEITHRDLKPENLLLKASNQGWLIKIVDFGLSNTHDGGRLLSTACGSPCYAAPEMIAGKKYKGPGADTWSLGVILFALVCGYLPFEDANTSNLYRKILNGEYTTPKWISAEVKDLIRKILETKPEKRLTIPKIREHIWMKGVPLEMIPRDVPYDEDEAEAVKRIVTQKLIEQNVDIQAVFDAVSSHACNSLSAMYFLNTQKELARYREEKALTQNSKENLRTIPSNRTDISTNSTKPESSTSEKNQANVTLAPIKDNNNENKDEKTDSDATNPIKMKPIVSPEHRTHTPAEPVILKKVPEGAPSGRHPKVPSLDLNKTQELRIEGTLQSQSARPQPSSGPSLGSKAPAKAVSQTARPTPTPITSTNMENIHIPAASEDAPLKGTLQDFFPKEVSPSKDDQNQMRKEEDAAAEERPSTRRSKSRRGDSEGNYIGEGPGTGKIEYEDARRLTDKQLPLSAMEGISLANKHSLQPVVPSQPQRSNLSRGSNRKGRSITQTDRSAVKDAAVPLNALQNQNAPLNRPPSGQRSGSRNAPRRKRSQQQSLQQETAPVLQVNQAELTRGRKGQSGSKTNTARDLARLNKQQQQQSGGYNIISGGDNKVAMV